MSASGFPPGVHRWRAEFEHALAVLGELPDGVDSWNPHRPSMAMVIIAQKVANSIARDLPQPSVAAGTNGTIQIKWQRPNLETSIFIYPDCTLEFLSRDNRGQKTGDLKISQVNDLFAEF